MEDPLEALPFLAELIPALHEAIDTIADPEARDVAIETHKALVEMQANGVVLSQTKAFRRPEVINTFAQERFGGRPETRLALRYAAYVIKIPILPVNTLHYTGFLFYYNEN